MELHWLSWIFILVILLIIIFMINIVKVYNVKEIEHKEAINDLETSLEFWKKCNKLIDSFKKEESLIELRTQLAELNRYFDKNDQSEHGKKKIKAYEELFEIYFQRKYRPTQAYFDRYYEVKKYI